MTPFSIKLPSGQTYTFSDWGDYEIYARCQFLGNNAQSVIIFQAVESNDLPGGAAANCTLLDTNLEQPSSLPVDNQMVIMSIQIEPDEANSAHQTPGLIVPEVTFAGSSGKWRNVFANTFFSFTISRSKPFAEGPISQFPTGGGLYMRHCGFQAAALAAIDFGYHPTNGVPSAMSARLLALPIWIGTMQTFRGQFSWPRGALVAGGTPATSIIGLTTYLYGPRQRPVT